MLLDRRTFFSKYYIHFQTLSNILYQYISLVAGKNQSTLGENYAYLVREIYLMHIFIVYHIFIITHKTLIYHTQNTKSSSRTKHKFIFTHKH